MFTYAEAHNELRRHFYTKFVDACQNGINTVGTSGVSQNITYQFLDVKNNAYVPKVYFQNVQDRDLPKLERHFLRFSAQDVANRQTSMAGERSGVCLGRYTADGVLAVQLFLSKSRYSNSDEDHLSMFAHYPFVGKKTTNGIWFRNPTIVAIDPQPNYFRVNVISEYIYETAVQRAVI